MKTFEEFKEKIEPSLQKLEDFRLGELAAAQKAQIYYVVPALLAILSIPVYWKINPVMAFIVFAIAVAVGLQIAMDMVGKPAKNYSTNFKKKAFSAFAKVFYPKTSYSLTKKIPKKTFLSSELFETAVEYEGQDHFKGQRADGCTFQFSEVAALLDEDAARSEASFEGFFFEIEMRSNYQAKILLFPSKGKPPQKALHELSQLSLEGLTAAGKLVPVANVYPKFEKDFEVYSHSKEMAYNVLTPKMIEGIYMIKQRWNLQPSISFIHKKIYVAIPTTLNFFEYTIHDSLLEPRIMQQLYDELAMCFGVIESLDIEKNESVGKKNLGEKNIDLMLDNPLVDLLDEGK